MEETTRPINKAIIHCSDTYHNMDIGAAEIDKWHKARGWKKGGYHWIIRRDGELEKGREESEIGAHCLGENTDSIGIVFVGGKAGKGAGANNFTVAQMQIGKMLMQDLAKKYPGITFHPHNEFDPGKSCPVFDIDIIKPITDE